MKKFISIVMSAAMLVTCIFSGAVTAAANTKKTAQEITLNQTVGVYVDYVNSQYWLQFTPTYTGYFEFACSSAAPSGMILGSIYDASEEVLMMNASTAGDADFITAAELEAGDTYYFVLETDGTAYSTYVTVRPHNHIYSVAEIYPAICDVNDSLNNSDGANYTFCAYCSDYITNAVYYYPAGITLKNKKVTYNGKKKTNTVTVRDRMGNVITPSNYKVTYKNNIKPGKVTVTVTFNNKVYSGQLTSSFIIIPRKPTISSIKSPKKKQLKVTWKKDTTVSGYQLQYSTSKKFYKTKTKTVAVSKKNASKTISKLKSKKRYYVRVRSYKTISGKKMYGTWSSVKSVKVK